MKKLELGQELSKNEQKKIMGGATLQCKNGPWPDNWRQVVYNFPSCAQAPAYCAGAQSSTVDYCY